MASEYEIVAFRWHDAVTADEADEVEAGLIESVACGILIKKTRRYITVAAAVWSNGTKGPIITIDRRSIVKDTYQELGAIHV